MDPLHLGLQVSAAYGVHRPLDRMKVIVIGAGIVGVSSALRALEHGHEVTIVDKQAPGQGASYGNAGVLAAGSIVPVTVPGLVAKVPRMLMDPLSPLYLRWRYLPALVPWLIRYLSHANRDRASYIADHMAPLVAESREEHLSLASDSEAARHIRVIPYAFAFADRASFESDPFGFDLRRRHGIRWMELEGAAVHEAEPALSQHYQFLARFDEHHGVIDSPGEYVQALARHFASLGGKVLREEVLSFERAARGITGIKTTNSVHHADKVVIACGAWSAKLLSTIGIHVPLESERGYHVEFLDCSLTPQHALMIADGKFVVTPMSGRLRAAGLVEFGGLDAPPSPAPLRALKRKITEIFPGLEYADTREWLGHRPALPDSLPAIGEVPGYPGLIAAFGHHHVGLTSGPRTGRIVAQLIGGVRSNLDLRPYGLERFLGSRTQG